MWKFNDDGVEILMDGTTYNRSFKALLKCAPEISIEIVETKHPVVKQYPAIKLRFEKAFPLYEDIYDNFFVFIAKDRENKSHLFVVKPDNYLLGFEKSQLYVYSQDEYGYTEDDIIDEVIEGGNENIYKVLQTIIAEHSLNMEVTL